MGRLAAWVGGWAALLVLLAAQNAAPPHGPAYVSTAPTSAARALLTPPPADTTDTLEAAGALTRRVRALNDSALAADTLAADTSAADTLRTFPRAERYLPRRRPSRTARLFPTEPSLLATRPRAYRHALSADSTGREFVAEELLGEEPLRAPLRVTRDAYASARRDEGLRANWRELAETRRRQRRRSRGGLGVNIVVPGGRQSAFSTIFGKPEVDLRLTGQADINAGFDYRKSDQQAAITGDASRIDPAFKQDLRLGITGSVGDKLQIDVNWDTQSQFDYQNQVKLEYTGYDDEILQKVEAGNVFLRTPSSLIRGGQSLFGIRSELQLGGVRLTTVASQQEGQSSSLSIEGGAETSAFTFKPTDYDADKHFFLAYYFRNRWNEALADPGVGIQLGQGFNRITEVQVWKLRGSQSFNSDREDVRDAIAVVDLGEPPEILEEADGYITDANLPGAARFGGLPPDQYTEEVLRTLRDGQTNPVSYLGTLPAPLEGPDLQNGEFQLLDPARDYVFDDRLGYISLTQRLQDNEALAVAFRYEANGQTVEVGDFTGEGGGATGGANGDRIVLKLLRPSGLISPTSTAGAGPAVWYLQLRNIYDLRGRNFRAQDFDLSIDYEPPGRTPVSTLPELGQVTLLRLLGLDRLDQQGAERPDDEFDFVNGFTINNAEGLLIFPFLEPFGRHLAGEIAGRADGAEAEALQERYVFRDLYRKKQQLAKTENTEQDVYTIRGEYQGVEPDFYDLRSIGGVVEGSVRVTSGGTALQEGSDFEVDYQGGTVLITNETFLTDGRSINIEYEENSLFSVQQKTLLGARADYALEDRFALGATVMRLSERAPVDKFRLGQEPIANMIWGVDGSVDLEPRWLTRAVDALPLVQTRARSAFSVSGEVAQFRPGHTQTQAFERTRRNLQDEDNDFAPDELGGISYIDDFEGFENAFSLKSQLRAWQLSAPPAGLRVPMTPAAAAGEDSAAVRSRWRSTFGWYQVNQNIREQLQGVPGAEGEGARLVEVREVFPNRDTRGELDNTLTTLDVYFDPQQRGPYNYTTDLSAFLQNPKAAWGGMTQRLPDGYNDFSVQNVEFVEFIFKPVAEGGAGASQDAMLYVDLGSISEDVLPNEKLNAEDGLSTSSFSEDQFVGNTRLPSGSQQGAVDINDGRTEDLGLDGLASYEPDCFTPSGAYASCLYPEIATEHGRLSAFLDGLAGAAAGPGVSPERFQAELARARRDPSADDYHHYEDDGFFEDPALFPGGASFQERFSRYYAATELNAYETQNTLAPAATSGRGNAREPDTEDLNFNATVDVEDNYFQYAVPLDLGRLDALARPEAQDDYVVGEITRDDGTGTGWYQVRIPVRALERDTVGRIRDFSLIESMRVWTTGHEAPMTLRFATLELVGSQWRTSDQVSVTEDGFAPFDPDAPDGPVLTISSINNEENAGLYKKPESAIVSQTQTTSGARQNAREQALVLRLENVKPGEQRAIYKTNAGGQDLLRYSNLRMFAHLHGETSMGPLRREDRGKAVLFLRLGANQTSDYYEYEQPLTPSRIGPGVPADSLWLPDLNGVNLRLSALNQLKVARDNDLSARQDSIYWSDENGVGLDPSPRQFSPGGDARIGIKGTPSLQNISTFVIGVRNADGSEVLRDVTVWVNELRATGYDEENGWAAIAQANVQLADLGRIVASFQSQTDGFGALSSTLGARDQRSFLNWGLELRDVSLDKFLPERYGWRIPVSMQLRSETSTPRYAPSRGDVRIDEILAQIDADEQFDDQEREESKAEVIREAQTHRLRRSVTVGLRKQDSNSRLLRNTLDGLALSYSYSDAEARSPSQKEDDGWNWSTAAQYRLGIGRPRTVRPLWFLDGAPLIGGVLGGLEFNYAPTSLSLTASAQRSFTQQQARPRGFVRSEEVLPERLREQHRFTHTRGFDLQYNPFEFLRLGFGTTTDQNFNAIGTEDRFGVVTEEDGLRLTDDDGDPFTASTADAFVRDRARDSLGGGAYRQDLLDLRPTSEVIEGIFSGRGPRTENYRQRFTATLSLPFARSEALNWINLDDIAYQATFGWQNQGLGRATGASASNEMQVRGGLSVRPQDFWRKFGFYRRLEEGSNDEPPRVQTDADSTEDGGSSFLSALRPASVLRRLALAVTGMEDVSISYNGNRRGRSSNVGREVSHDDIDYVDTDHTFLDAFRNRGASLGYRFGLERDIGFDNRVFGENLNVTDILSSGNEVRARTTLAPGERFRIDLAWDVNWSQGQNITYQNGGRDVLETSNGRNVASVWAFGASYLDFFKRQLVTLQADVAAGEDADDDGRVVLTNGSLRDDFRSSFVRDLGTLGGRGLLPVPLPGWTVTYSGLSDWPLLRSLTQSASVRHGYDAEFRNSFRSNTAGDENSFTLGERTFTFTPPAFLASDLGVVERYRPFVGVDLAWRGDLQTNVAWNQTNAFLLSATSRVTESRTNELTFSASFRRQGLKIPILPLGRLNNRVSLSVTVSRAQNLEQEYLLTQALQDAAADPGAYDPNEALTGDNVSEITNSTRLQVTPKVGYQFSNRVSADFLLQYENFQSDNSRRPPYITLNGGFNVRVSVSN